MWLLVISEDLVHKKLVGLVANKAPVVDGLLSNVFINTADSISLPLYLIFQRSLNSGEIPADWKKAIFVRYLKKVQRMNVRTIDLLVLRLGPVKYLKLYQEPLYANT